MRLTLLIILLSTINFSASCAGIGKWLEYLKSLPGDAREISIDSFFQARPVFPCSENDTIMYFFYRGEARSVSLAGDFNNWKPQAQFQQVEGSSFWFLKMTFLPDARLDYKLVINNRDWITDPMNPSIETSGFGVNSAFSMPAYLPSSMAIAYDSVPQGKTVSFSIQSRFLHNTREVTYYLPVTYDPSAFYPMILFHDGPEYIRLAHATIILDNLIYAQKIQPVIAVFVPPVDRTAEYAGQKQKKFISYITKELLPEVEKQLNISSDPMQRAVLGASYGGNISLVLATRHPQLFGKVAAQSGYVQPSLYSYVRNEDRVPLSIYLDMGIYDIPVLIPLMHDFAHLINPKSHQVWYREISQGHSWGSWRDHLAEVLEYFFARR
ncbi:MAG: alpha/beta hydrolase-fold protein [Bacteroidales bacterium]|nr:alpha/beta hydrolase-fold protein [Bacteroidales bacterium]MDZ4205082.1 alpha/beta hydrolase-fold protein [Bacteroidales bacterium]